MNYIICINYNKTLEVSTPNDKQFMFDVMVKQFIDYFDLIHFQDNSQQYCWLRQTNKDIISQLNYRGMYFLLYSIIYIY